MATVSAIGGDGGRGGGAGLGDDYQRGAHGSGGNAFAQGVIEDALGDVSLRVEARGGSAGGSARIQSLTPTPSEASGGEARLGRVFASSRSGHVSVAGILEQGRSDLGLESAGTARDAILHGVVDANAPEGIDLRQWAEASSGQPFWDEADGVWRAPRAESTLDLEKSTDAMRILSVAKTGLAFQSSDQRGLAFEGGDTRSRVRAVNHSGSIDVDSRAERFGSPFGRNTGDGESIVHAETFGDAHDILVRSDASGGSADPLDGDLVYFDGGDAKSRVVAVAHGDAAIDVTSQASAGAGGGALSDDAIAPGFAGSSLAEAIARNSGVSTVTATSSAGGGYGRADEAPGGKGEIRALSEATGLGISIANARVYGDRAGTFGGRMTATARATGRAAARARSTASPGANSQLHSRAHLSLDSDRIRNVTVDLGAQGKGYVGAVAQVFESDLADPSTSTPATASEILVAVDERHASGPDLAQIGIRLRGGANESADTNNTQKATISIAIHTSFLRPNQHLALRFDDLSASPGPGDSGDASSIHVRILFGGSELLDRGFSSASAAASFFEAGALELAQSDRKGERALTIEFERIAESETSVFEASWTLVVVPEPSTALLIGLGLLCLAGGRPASTR